ncbi:MAG: hypothetical protein NTW94_01620 [Legionellales bacterium]|nr:hypothetical protein [Legionellales bacterium]
MKHKKKEHERHMFEEISQIIEKTGADDAGYVAEKKALDIFAVLESLLAYTIYATSVSPETIRDSAEESYVNIKRQALHMLKENPIE